MAPTLLADAGRENANGEVDALIESGLLQRVLAQTEIGFSNSMIEASWRSLKHQWLYLNDLDTIARLRSLVASYVSKHSALVPHTAFQGQTPDKMVFGKADGVPERLTTARDRARRERLAHTRGGRCAACLAGDVRELEHRVP